MKKINGSDRIRILISANSAWLSGIFFILLGLQQLRAVLDTVPVCRILWLDSRPSCAHFPGQSGYHSYQVSFCDRIIPDIRFLENGVIIRFCTLYIPGKPSYRLRFRFRINRISIFCQVYLKLIPLHAGFPPTIWILKVGSMLKVLCEWSKPELRYCYRCVDFGTLRLWGKWGYFYCSIRKDPPYIATHVLPWRVHS